MSFDTSLFEEHFHTSSSSACMTCECGTTYFCQTDHSEEEIENERQAGSVFVDFFSRRITFEGKEYSDLCDCWKERAEKISNFLTSHHRYIVPYLNAVKAMKQHSADSLPSGE